MIDLTLTPEDVHQFTGSTILHYHVPFRKHHYIKTIFSKPVGVSTLPLTKQVGFIGLDQYGNLFKLHQHPRKELLEQLAASHAHKMYRDTQDGRSQHVGYVIRNHWITVFRLCELEITIARE